MTGSLKGRLFVILVLSTGLVWAFATAWIYLSTRAEVERVLDARLTEAARMVSSLVDSQEIDVTVASLDASAIPRRRHNDYERQISCQIWSLSGSLIGRSDGAPETRMSDASEGFSERDIDGRAWRVYAVRNEAAGVQVLVGDNLDIRARLVRDVVKGLILPMLLVVPALGTLLWVGVGRGMRPLDRLADGLARREAGDLHPIASEGAAAEIRPVVTALNGLFGRVHETRERERHFLAYAAHELRTPLAGLKTQAEISLRTDREDVRRTALTQIVTAVERTSRLVRQLLDTAGAEAAGGERAGTRVDLGRIVREVSDEQAGRASVRGIGITLMPPVGDAGPAVDETLAVLAVRNLIENAVNHSPDGGMVTVRWDASRLEVVDAGDGMREEEIGRAAERFFRGANRTAVGSGLGLTIVELCARRMNAELVLANLPPHGFSATLRFDGRNPEADPKP